MRSGRKAQRRAARAQPAVPAPTMIKSGMFGVAENVRVVRGRKKKRRVELWNEKDGMVDGVQRKRMEIECRGNKRLRVW